MKFSDELITELRQARRLVFFTGAGISAESGVPTFRDAHHKHRVNFDVNTYATVFGFSTQPALVWEWYEEKRQALLSLQPNPAHTVIADWQAKAPEVSVITQNIDGFHQRAGSVAVIELHGNIFANKCLVQGHPFKKTTESHLLAPPYCPECDSHVRPDIVWFDEEASATLYAQAAKLCQTCEVFICIGTALDVDPVAKLPLIAKASGAYLLQINPHRTLIDCDSHCNLRGPAGEILPLLWQAVWSTSPLL